MPGHSIDASLRRCMLGLALRPSHAQFFTVASLLHSRPLRMRGSKRTHIRKPRAAKHCVGSERTVERPRCRADWTLAGGSARATGPLYQPKASRKPSDLVSCQHCRYVLHSLTALRSECANHAVCVAIRTVQILATAQQAQPGSTTAHTSKMTASYVLRC